ncbi:MAG: hypothetical protein PF437_06760 [Sulfurimonas sp.]|jgi:superfamily II DNA/RNA helicase|nr:hypothetical protein [Sulfurimonas sp.]
MSSTSITIKPNNHRVLPCPNDKKLSLVNKLISDNRDYKIIVVTSTDSKIVEEFLQNNNSQSPENVQVVDDKTLIKDENLTCDLLISLDVPGKAVIYIARLAHTTSRALLLLNETEQKLLYPIETLLGRVIKQDITEGFEYEVKETPYKDPRAPKKMTPAQIKEEAKKRYDEKTGEPKPKREYNSDDKKDFKKDFKRDDKKDFKKDFKIDDKKDFKKDFNKSDKDNKWAKKDKEPNKYLGKDENGKAIFSGKSGDRNHRHDGSQREEGYPPKKVGRKINIKSLKKPEDKKD